MTDQEGPTIIYDCRGCKFMHTERFVDAEAGEENFEIFENTCTHPNGPTDTLPWYTPKCCPFLPMLPKNNVTPP